MKKQNNNKKYTDKKKTKIKLVIGVSLLTFGLIGIGIMASFVSEEKAENHFLNNQKIVIDSSGNEIISWPSNYQKWTKDQKYKVGTKYYDNSSDLNNFW